MRRLARRFVSRYPLSNGGTVSDTVARAWRGRRTGIRYGSERIAGPYLIPCIILVSGCAIGAEGPTLVADPLPMLQGSVHHVQPGETIWRLAHAYGLDVSTLAAVNGLPHESALQAGQSLRIPLPSEPDTAAFTWPAYGPTAPAEPGGGVRITIPHGSLVRAMRAGSVAAAPKDLARWGPVLVLDHHNGVYSVYGGLDRLLVLPGTVVRQGTPIAVAGPDGLYVEVRRGANPQDVLSLLP